MGPADQVNPQATINQGNQIAGEQQGYNTEQANQQTGITLGQIAPAQQAYNVGSQAGSQYNQAKRTLKSGSDCSASRLQSLMLVAACDYLWRFALCK